MRFNHDYWHKTIIENTWIQIKCILLEWTNDFTSFSLISNPFKVLNRDNSDPSIIFSNNLHNGCNNTESTLLQESPFHSIYHIIKTFLMKEILRIYWNSNKINKELDNLQNNKSNIINKSIHPLFSLYNTMDSRQFTEYQKINGLLAYLKIIDYVKQIKYIYSYN